ncbi:Hypothetical Protein NG00_00482 [Corynebacterium camporealensis]|uniref:Uncharacterized protein n=2 Tax=Corynebacterium camporealensis TaxID=161896 RepID=A0A0F6TAS1_9CORY|nr:hypothetical protein UL81_02650 [Corynebacterium camporealensis]AVH87810.1 Hypothetical Protein NG00_00482 [Corynebacterium camporealensis]
MSGSFRIFKSTQRLLRSLLSKGTSMSKSIPLSLLSLLAVGALAACGSSAEPEEAPESSTSSVVESTESSTETTTSEMQSAEPAAQQPVEEPAAQQLNEEPQGERRQVIETIYEETYPMPGDGLFYDEPVVGFTEAPGQTEPYEMNKTIRACGDTRLHQTGTTFFTDGTSGWTAQCADAMS